MVVCTLFVLWQVVTSTVSLVLVDDMVAGAIPVVRLRVDDARGTIQVTQVRQVQPLQSAVVYAEARTDPPSPLCEWLRHLMSMLPAKRQ